MCARGSVYMCVHVCAHVYPELSQSQDLGLGIPSWLSVLGASDAEGPTEGPSPDSLLAGLHLTLKQ